LKLEASKELADPQSPPPVVASPPPKPPPGPLSLSPPQHSRSARGNHSSGCARSHGERFML
jgi:hypothetical protein